MGSICDGMNGPHLLGWEGQIGVIGGEFDGTRLGSAGAPELEQRELRVRMLEEENQTSRLPI
jgi:hypothetical protein